jgi:hypothetical protein
VPAASPHRLIHRGGPILPDLAYKTFYYGDAWKADPAHADNPHALARQKIDAAIAAAMQDGGLNAMLAQYFDGAAVTCTAHPSEILDDDPRGAPIEQPFNERDIRRIVRNLLPGRLAGFDFGRTVVNIVLPLGASVQVLGLDEKERPTGASVEPGVPLDTPYFGSDIAGYHGSVPAKIDGAEVEVLYSVVVWSDGAVGIPVPQWEGWENIVATLYHELQETRTNPYVDVAVRTGKASHIGWNTDPLPGPGNVADCREIADLPLLVADALETSFTRVAVTAADGSRIAVPIQRLWSNRDGGMHPA